MLEEVIQLLKTVMEKQPPHVGCRGDIDLGRA
jgi:hypothetical protein